MSENDLIFKYTFAGITIYASKAEFGRLFELLPDFPYLEEYVGERWQLEGENL